MFSPHFQMVPIWALTAFLKNPFASLSMFQILPRRMRTAEAFKTGDLKHKFKSCFNIKMFVVCTLCACSLFCGIVLYFFEVSHISASVFCKHFHVLYELSAVNQHVANRNAFLICKCSCTSVDRAKDFQESY